MNISKSKKYSIVAGVLLLIGAGALIGVRIIKQRAGANSVLPATSTVSGTCKLLNSTVAPINPAVVTVRAGVPDGFTPPQPAGYAAWTLAFTYDGTTSGCKPTDKIIWTLTASATGATFKGTTGTTINTTGTGNSIQYTFTSPASSKATATFVAELPVPSSYGSGTAVGHFYIDASVNNNSQSYQSHTDVTANYSVACVTPPGLTMVFPNKDYSDFNGPVADILFQASLPDAAGASVVFDYSSSNGSPETVNATVSPDDSALYEAPVSLGTAGLTTSYTITAHQASDATVKSAPITVNIHDNPPDTSLGN